MRRLKMQLLPAPAGSQLGRTGQPCFTSPSVCPAPAPAMYRDANYGQDSKWAAWCRQDVAHIRRGEVTEPSTVESVTTKWIGTVASVLPGFGWVDGVTVDKHEKYVTVNSAIYSHNTHACQSVPSQAQAKARHERRHHNPCPMEPTGQGKSTRDATVDRTPELRELQGGGPAAGHRQGQGSQEAES